MKRVVIFGATSAVAVEVGRIYAQERAHILLVGRREQALNDIAVDLETRGALQTTALVYDLADFTRHDELISAIFDNIDEPNTFLFANGTLPDQKACEESYDHALVAIEQNALSQISLLTRLANVVEQRKAGTIAVITSVAGDRGRQSNYIYGAAKGFLTRYIEGLGHRLAKSGVKVVDIKPGFIDTPMTKHLDKGGPLWATPEQVAEDIVKAINKGKHVKYTPWFWYFIMMVIRCVPTTIFKKTSL